MQLWVINNCIGIESLTHSGHFLGITLKIKIVEQTRSEVILCGHNACFLSIDIIQAMSTAKKKKKLNNNNNKR